MSNLIILTYHSIDSRRSVTSTSPTLFQWQMEQIADLGLSGISLDQAFAHLSNRGRFPSNSVILTFDDGYLDFFETVLPVMDSLGFSATIFVVSGLVGMKAARARSVNPDIDRDLLGWGHLKELAATGFEIGSHSVSHDRLTQLAPGELNRELDQSRQTLQQRLQLPVDGFAFPYGDLSTRVCEATRRYYQYACTTRLGYNQTETDPLQLNRVDSYYLKKPAVFNSVIRGGLAGYLRFRQTLRQIKQHLA